ncbi:hypothetical protein lbkm_3886 [Lachnospiraceae bacterium KM106-2]|nr:hypothetical protein lbkm_3886 [Lachnospiraceae bacterium KM106-2]
MVTIGCKREKAVVVKTLEEKKTSAKEVKPEEKTYSFVDVLGNAYQTELLSDVAKNKFDLSRIITKKGYRYYTDEKGKIISRLGIDVSKYQGDIDFKKVKETGIDFVIIRLGFRGYGKDGKIKLDEKFKKNCKAALDSGLKVGVYFFSQAINEKEAKEEAAFVIKHLKKYKITYPVVFDTEEMKVEGARTEGIKKEIFTNNCITFCDAIKKAGYHPMIYANMKWMAFTLDLPKLESYDKWYADYEALPQSPYQYSIWQYTETGKVDGVKGNVDLNVDFIGY